MCARPGRRCEAAWLCVRSSQRNVPMLPFGLRLTLGERGLERGAEHGARAPRLDDVVDVAALGGGVRVREPLLVVRDELGATRVRVLRLGQLVPEDDVR